MTSSKRLGITFFAIVASVCADPRCEKFGEKEVVCVADIEDFVLRKGFVSEITQATKITLSNCRITDIERGAFENNDFLQYIDLSENKISNLKPGVLDGNGPVTHLNLSNNMLATVPSGLFDQKPNLEILDLKSNRINSLRSHLFVSLRKLVHLDLSYNDFVGKDLNPYIFSKNIKMKYLDFSTNDMSNSPDSLLQTLQELEHLSLDRCTLQNVPLFVTKANLRTLKHLTLSTNQISQIDQERTFMNMESLEVLNLDENLIETVTINAFIHLKNIKVISLRNNKLKTLPGGFFRNLIKLESVDLSHNLLEYIPIDAFRGTAVQDLNLSDNRFSYLDAYFCVQLRNAGIKLSKLYLGGNPWQCACLNDIINELKSFSISYDDAKYNGKNPVCVTTKIFRCQRQEITGKFYVELYDNAIIKGNNEDYK